MDYRKFPGTDITASALGFGCMRLPTTDAEKHPIDRKIAVKMLRDAIDKGVTYVDTAYGYHDGESEAFVGEALGDGYRDKVTLTTKLPLWLVEKTEDMERLLDTQLTRLKVDHVDFYLAHAVSRDRYEKLLPLGLLEFFTRMVEKGKIRYPGFSFHDDASAFRMVLDSYPWKLAQVQMNFFDEFHQATLDGVKYAAEKGVGVVVMEPLRGGSLARNIPAEVQKLYDDAPVQRSGVEWAMRWLYDRPEVMTILSGMSTPEQVADNLRIFETAQANAMKDWEHKLMTSAREAYERNVAIGCTGCRYCQPCPQEIPIPNLFRHYDECTMFASFDFFFQRYRHDIKENRCVECGACEAACPQGIHVREWLKRIDMESKR